MKIFIPKDDQRLPDFFTVVVNYLTGRKETIEVASLKYITDMECYEIWTRENMMKVIYKGSLESLDYDKNWSKIVELKDEKDRKKIG